MLGLGGGGGIIKIPKRATLEAIQCILDKKSNMPNKSFILIFLILAILVWSFSWWGYYAYFLVIGLFENSQFALNVYFAIGFFLFFLAYIALQIKSLKKDKSGLIPQKLFLSIAGFLSSVFALFYTFAAAEVPSGTRGKPRPLVRQTHHPLNHPE
jgi:hypothetical protein